MICVFVTAEELLLFFFFQAEAGIRYFCLTRGIGYVYKRQIKSRHDPCVVSFAKPGFEDMARGQRGNPKRLQSVSYIYLTQPTTYSETILALAALLNKNTTVADVSYKHHLPYTHVINQDRTNVSSNT